MTAFDSFTGFVYQAFIVSPAISWILQPGRFSKQRGFVYAVSFLVALAAISIVRASYSSLRVCLRTLRCSCLQCLLTLHACIYYCCCSCRVHGPQYMQFKEQESNFYHVIGAPRDASFSDIKKAFRSRSIDLHPDKNPSPTAVADFNRLRLALDVRHPPFLKGSGRY